MDTSKRTVWHGQFNRATEVVCRTCDLLILNLNHLNIITFIFSDFYQGDFFLHSKNVSRNIDLVDDDCNMIYELKQIDNLFGLVCVYEHFSDMTLSEAMTIVRRELFVRSAMRNIFLFLIFYSMRNYQLKITIRNL